MPNKAIDAQVFCPFYLSEDDRSISCESLIGGSGCSSVQRFPSRELKVFHERDFCTSTDCAACSVFAALYAKYSERRNPS